MSNYCMNCGEQDVLEVLPTPEDSYEPFLEHGELQADGSFSLERNVAILCCSACGHEQIDLSS